jgi:hypothetical protein
VYGKFDDEIGYGLLELKDFSNLTRTSLTNEIFKIKMWKERPDNGNMNFKLVGFVNVHVTQTESPQALNPPRPPTS